MIQALSSDGLESRKSWKASAFIWGDHILDTVILWVAMDVPVTGKGRKGLCKVALDVGKEHSVSSCNLGRLILFLEPGKMEN